MDISTDYMYLDESDYLRKMLGPKHLPLKLVLPVTFAYVTIFVTGVFGNVMTCIVIKKNPIMQTATNYYLFNLAISDLLLLILGLPNELWIFWEQYPWQFGLCMCKIRAFTSEMSSYASVLTIVAFSLERYLAICHPLRLYRMSGLKRPLRFILGTWLIAFIFAIPFAIYTTVNYIEYPPKSGRNLEASAMCAMLLSNMPDFPLYELSCLIFFLVPMAFIAVLYVKMCLKIQKNSLGSSIEGSIHGETRQTHSRKIVRMLIAVVIMFFVCWAPFHAQRLLYVYQVSTFEDINEWLYPLGGCLYYFSTTVNPILYNVMSVKYRVAFKEILSCYPTNLSIAKSGTSSVKDATVYEYESTKELPEIRINSTNFQEDDECNSEKSTQISLTKLRLNKQDEEEEEEEEEAAKDRRVKKSIDESTIEDKFGKKSSFVIQSCNGRTRCWTKKKEAKVPSDEAHI